MSHFSLRALPPLPENVIVTAGWLQRLHSSIMPTTALLFTSTTAAPALPVVYILPDAPAVMMVSALPDAPSLPVAPALL